MDKKQVLKKTLKITGDVLLYAFVIICLFSVLLTITAKKDPDGTATIFGRQMRYVQTASMEKCDETDVSKFEIKDIPVNSMIFIEAVPKNAEEAAAWYSDLKVGDVLTFKYVYLRQETITHRIIAIEEKATGGYIIKLAGDNKSENSENLVQVIDTSDANSMNYVIGKVTSTNYLFGLFITTLKHPAGIVCLIIMPAFAIMLFEIYKVMKLINADKKSKENAERQAQKNELEELRRRLAELEANKSDASDSDDSKKEN
jgi:hypothetical protein